MKTNKKMKNLLKGIDLKSLEADSFLQKDLQKLANSGFVETEGCIVLKDLENQGEFVQLEDLPDKTGYECFVNKFHVEDYFDKDTSMQSLLENAVAFAFKLKKNLLTEFADKSFEIIISINKRNCVIYFHKIRINEDWLAQDIESYKNEGVLAMVA